MTGAASPVVLVEREAPLAWITLNRPDAMNAINDAMRAELPARLAELEADASVRVIVLRGAGSRAFCAGADIKEFAPVASAQQFRDERLHGHWSAAFGQTRKPTIAAIHGFCLGGGLEIALGCDIRVASDDASFALPEVSRGIITGSGGSQRLLRMVGLGRSLDMMLTGERMSAAEAHRIGLVTRLAPAGEVEALARRVGLAIAANAPLAVAAAKEALHRGSEMALSDGFRLELDLLTMLIGTQDRLEAAAAFHEKRKAEFRGC